MTFKSNKKRKSAKKKKSVRKRRYSRRRSRLYLVDVCSFTVNSEEGKQRSFLSLHDMETFLRKRGFEDVRLSPCRDCRDLSYSPPPPPRKEKNPESESSFVKGFSYGASLTKPMRTIRTSHAITNSTCTKGIGITVLRELVEAQEDRRRSLSQV